MHHQNFTPPPPTSRNVIKQMPEKIAPSFTPSNYTRQYLHPAASVLANSLSVQSRNLISPYSFRRVGYMQRTRPPFSLLPPFCLRATPPSSPKTVRKLIYFKLPAAHPSKLIPAGAETHTVLSSTMTAMICLPDTWHTKYSYYMFLYRYFLQTKAHWVVLLVQPLQKDNNYRLH